MGCGASGEEKYEVPQQDGLGGLYEARGHDSASPRRKAPYAFGTAICSSDEELMEALERHPRKLAVPYGCRQVTALGMERFAKEAKRLQKNKELSMDLEIVAYFCGWTDDHLAPLGRVCLAALDIGANPRISPGAILRFGAVSAELPRPITAAEGPRPIIHFGECSWPEEVLVALEVFDAYNQTSDALDRDLRMGIEEFEQWAADVKRSDFNWTQLCASVRCDPEAGLNVEQLIQIFRAGHMPVERPVGRTGRVKRGRAGREGHLREPSVEAVELLGQSNLPMPPGCMIDHGAYGLCLMRGALPPPRYGPRHYVVDCGQVGQHTLELQVIQERFRGRFSGQEGDPRQQQWSVARVPAASWSTKATELSLLEELVGAIGGTYTSQAEDSDDEEDNAALVTVSLAGCGVRDVTAAALSAALPGCPPRRALSLTVRDSGDLGRNR